ncbi:Tn3 family transposase [Cytobacillus firmus]|uniref:Mobile element protein n=2 Tax=Cytobacillus firmus TaxID=1399 RepID=A0A380XSM8_CYTFI|nr:transposase [Cytobacillus firmus]KAF0825179.1 Mobile element protein [Cytobacillus firmus]MDD9311985.1 Tn3 family transposase [Cytobacillus firmus]MEC1893848.1 Tn3 family transposase [Cytobacillus firmus]MED1905352.1 Tn3 family transposase [Cytobacillus firmus]MED1940149.1 Tn3 family transposase [Cytobacillus firmus]
MIYWHVAKHSTCIYSQLKSCSSSEVASMIEGVLKHCTSMEVENLLGYTKAHSKTAKAPRLILDMRNLAEGSHLLAICRVATEVTRKIKCFFVGGCRGKL